MPGRGVPACPARVRNALTAAHLAIDPEVFMAGWAAAMTLGLASVLVLGDPGMLAMAVAVSTPPIILWLRQDRRASLRRAELPAFVDAVAGAVAAGTSLGAAVSATRASLSSPLLDDVDATCARVDRGQSLERALEPWTADADADVRLVGHALLMLAVHGGESVRALDRTASTLRRRDDLRRERLAHATQARSSAAVMTMAPLAFAAVSGLADPRTLRFLIATPAGLMCLTVGVALDVLGARWMLAIARRAR